MKLKESLGFRFTLVLLIILIIGQGIGASWFIYSTRNNLMAALDAKVRSIGMLLTGMSVEPLGTVNYRLTGLNAYIDTVIKDDEIVGVKVVNKDGMVISTRVKEFKATRSLNPFSVKGVMELTTPVVSNGEKLGSVVIDYTGNTINETILRSLIFTALYQGILFILVVFAVSLFFNTDIRKPIALINNATEAVSMGDLTATLPIKREDEIGELTKGFSFLIERLRKTLIRLNSTAVNVAMAIKQIELIFERVIEAINNQFHSTDVVIGSIKEMDRSQDNILENTRTLSSSSTENLSSLLEIRATTEEVSASTSELFKSIEDAYSTIEEMSRSAKEVAISAEELSSSTEQTSASVEEINASLKEVEESAKQSAALATKVLEVTSEIGMMAVVDAIEGMEKISEEVRNSSEIIKGLGSKSKDIEKILSVIKAVTEQTNLLSLNAAILAAQAGEYGKGFSVVADEIRGLADRTAASTKEIAEIIRAIQGGIAEAVASAERGMERVDDGNSLVMKVGDALRQTLHASEQSTDMARAIEKATVEQARGIKQITDAMDMMKRIVQHVAMATHEQGIGSEHIVNVIEKVKEIAELVKRGMEEQTAGIKVISRNLEIANERVSYIRDSNLQQKKADDGILTGMENIRSIGNNTLQVIEEMSLSLNTLYNEAESLKKEVEGFKLG